MRFSAAAPPAAQNSRTNHYTQIRQNTAHCPSPTTSVIHILVSPAQRLSVLVINLKHDQQVNSVHHRKACFIADPLDAVVQL